MKQSNMIETSLYPRCVRTGLLVIHINVYAIRL